MRPMRAGIIRASLPTHSLRAAYRLATRTSTSLHRSVQVRAPPCKASTAAQLTTGTSPCKARTFSSSVRVRIAAKMDAAKEVFFKADHYAVVGASKDPNKIGNKVMKWYIGNELSVIPIHPKEAAIEDVATVASIFDIHEPASTSVSVITPPHVTMPVIKTALLELKVAAIWLQPGAEDDEIKAWLDSSPDEIKEKVILGGPCILVEGKKLAKAQGKL